MVQKLVMIWDWIWHDLGQEQNLVESLNGDFLNLFFEKKLVDSFYLVSNIKMWL